MEKKKKQRTVIWFFYELQSSGLLPRCRLDNGENRERVSIPGKIIKSHLPIFQSDVPLTLMDCMALYSFNLIGMKSMPVLFLSETVPLNFTLIPSACHRGKGKRTSPLWGGATAAMRISHSVSSQAKEKKNQLFPIAVLHIPLISKESSLLDGFFGLLWCYSERGSHRGSEQEKQKNESEVVS